MKVIWTPEAQQDRVDVWDYIAADNPRAAARLDELFSAAAARLSNHPKLGRSGKIPGTRELVRMKAIALFTKSAAKPSGYWPWSIPRANGQHRLIERGGR